MNLMHRRRGRDEIWRGVHRRSTSPRQISPIGAISPIFPGDEKVPFLYFCTSHFWTTKFVNATSPWRRRIYTGTVLVAYRGDTKTENLRTGVSLGRILPNIQLSCRASISVIKNLGYSLNEFRSYAWAITFGCILLHIFSTPLAKLCIGYEMDLLYHHADI